MIAYDADTRAIRTDVFDGPLELLLFLVKREGVDIRDVAIAPITDAFLGHIALMEALDLDVAGEFLVLAATLCLLKSRELLPRTSLLDEEDDLDEGDLREQLARRLAEYERYREASLELGSRPMLDRDVFAPRPEPVTGDERPLDPGVDALGLLQVFYGVLQRHTAPPPVHHVEREHYSIEQMAGWILDQVSGGPRELTDLLSLIEHRIDRVIAFLASLEMARLQILDVSQAHHLGPVVLRGRVEAATVDFSVLSSGA